jgi:glycerophosphoryl diester phosphodiesterase
MKKAILTILVCLLTLGGWAQFPKMYAHRGCWSMTPSNEFIIPENSIPAVAMAKRMGYEGIECDVHYT